MIHEERMDSIDFQGQRSKVKIFGKGEVACGAILCVLVRVVSLVGGCYDLKSSILFLTDGSINTIIRG